jgi:hypothetical protein
VAPANFREHNATRQPFVAVGAQQANAPGGRRGHISPRWVRHEFVAGSEADALLNEYISRKAARSEVLERVSVAEQPIGIELDSGSKGADLVVASSSPAATEWNLASNDALYRRNSTFVQTVYSVSKRELLDLLDERNRVAANLATEAHEMRGLGVYDQVWTAAVRVERTPADERRAGATKLDAVSRYNLRNWMLLADSLGIDALSWGSSDRHHRVRRARDSMGRAPLVSGVAEIERSKGNSRKRRLLAPQLASPELGSGVSETFRAWHEIHILWCGRKHRLKFKIGQKLGDSTLQLG